MPTPARSAALLIVAAALLMGCGASGPAIAQEQTAAPADTSWWRDAVFYEVFVRSFADSEVGDLACDGVGDIQGLINRLDYLNDGDPSTTDDLGVTALWLMPIMPSPSYHGYDITDYEAINPEFGDLDDFRRLVDEAHERGMRVIIDLVLNHTSNAHPWYAEAADIQREHHDWYVWQEEPGDFLGPWNQIVWHTREGEFYYGIFGPHMPDLNYRNAEVTQAAYDVARFWLEEMNVDGFRLDAIRHLIEDGAVQSNTDATHDWLRGFRDFYLSVDPDAMTVGEVWDDTEEVVRYVGDELDLAFEFDLAGSILQAVNTGQASVLAEQQMKTWTSFPPGQYATFLRNHDQNRVMNVVEGDTAKAALAATLLLTSPGTPFLYYGEEIGMNGQKPDVMIRTPMQWSGEEYAGFSGCEPWMGVNDDYEAVNVAAQEDDENSLLNHYRRLVQLRTSHPALQSGDLSAVETGNPSVYAFLRTTPEEAILVVANLGDEAVTDYALAASDTPLRRAGSPAELLHDADVSAPRMRRGGFSGYQPLGTLEPQTGYVIRLAGN